MPYTYPYPRPAVTTDALVVTRENEQHCLLLVERKYDPYKGKWALPGGFVDIDEDLPEACARELKEETGITGLFLQQFATFGRPGRDPRGRTISVVFWAFVPEKLRVTAGDDAARAKWFMIENLPELAFDHEQIIEAFRKQIGY
ncbi:MAG TPA: NUDIX hydrolase [Prolixibacteraceae bacterium]|nr:NUDIX hydrolase [Prolixibacteraceae bacterium]